MSKKILVVDDSKVQLQLLVTLLGKKGYEVITASDGAQTVMRAHRERPDLILLDLMMPGGDGLSVCEKLQMSSHTNQIPIIVLTASEQPDIEARAQQALARFVIRKPLDADHLLARITEVLMPPRA